MSNFVYKNLKINYRVTGEGTPLLLLNGIMMSTKSWAPFERSFINNQIKLILLDLVDQGESDKLEEEYTQDIQVEVVNALLEELGIEKINIAATSYGGEVALLFASKYQNKVEKLILLNTVYRTNSWLREIGCAWNFSIGNPEAYYCTTIPTIYSPEFYDKRADWMNNRKKALTSTVFASEEFLSRMVRLTNSANNYNVSEKLKEINVPTLIVGCEQDHITPLEEQRRMVKMLPNASLVILPDTGHASFYERPVLFTSLVIGFLKSEDICI